MTKEIKILLFGAGLVGRQVLAQYLDRFHVLAFADNDPKKHNGTISDIKIIHPEQIKQFNYDYIVITSTSIEPIQNQLLELGVPKDKIKLYIDHVAIVKQRFPFDALVFIFLCISAIFYAFNIFFNYFQN